MEFLKKISAFFILTIYLFSVTESGELLKVPALVEHYYNSQQENSYSGVMSFLVMHYYTENGTDQDAAEDNQLPFNSQEHSASISLISLTPPLCIALPPVHNIEKFQAFGIAANSFLPAQYLAAIWQPPRYC